MSLLRLIPQCRALAAQATEASIAAAKAESDAREQRNIVDKLRQEVSGLKTQIIEIEEARLADRTRMLDWMCVAQRMAPIFSKLDDLPAAPPPPESPGIARPRADQLAEQYESEFLSSFMYGSGEPPKAN